MNLLDNETAAGEFTLIDDHKIGPLHTKLYALEAGKAKTAIREIELDRKLKVNGFREGRSPALRLYSQHRKTVEHEITNRLRMSITSQKKAAQDAVLPPEFTVQPWDGQGFLVIEARWVTHPHLPQPGEQFRGIMQANSEPGSIPGAPPLPQPGAPNSGAPAQQASIPRPQPGTAAMAPLGSGAARPTSLEVPQRPVPVASGSGKPMPPSN